MINISIIDDDRAMLEQMQKIVRDAAGCGDGISIAGYERPDAFLEENEKRKCQILVSDIDMPGMSGIETFEQMKDLELDIPVIFLTASGLEEDVVNAIRLGAVNYLMKPFQPQELMKRIAQEFEKQ